MRSNQNRQKRHTEERGQAGTNSDHFEEKEQEETHQLELEIEEEETT